ncbi:hypothetical protein GCM10022244_57960 [Streptomyces gulbargensis]|uniref:Uncharacterized protein n=1 Tax=Streptomyces gulbargensis TaxID=364901 RepID=A0ABP7NCA4_9ACTN
MTTAFTSARVLRLKADGKLGAAAGIAFGVGQDQERPRPPHGRHPCGGTEAEAARPADGRGRTRGSCCLASQSGPTVEAGEDGGVPGGDLVQAPGGVAGGGHRGSVTGTGRRCAQP